MSDANDVKTVSLVSCEDYDRERVYRAVKQSIDLIGGVGAFVSPGQKVFLKFNLLQGAAPEKCVTTHPEIVHAVARILKDHGCSVIMGDSPGSGSSYNENTLRKNYAESGFDKISAELGVPLNYGIGYREVSAPNGRMAKRFSVIDPALDADAVVIVSKAKTHTLTYMSGAAKNIFGVIPGFEKPLYHGKLPSSDDFGRLIIDINDVIKPKLQIMDAIMGMEGDGPHTGAPRKIGAVVASGDYSAVDVVTARLMSIDPKGLGTIKAAIERGYLLEDLSDVSIVGENIDTLIVRDYKHPSTYSGPRKDGVRYPGMMGRLLSIASEASPRPRINPDKCIGCMKCVRSCPKKMITVVNKKPRISYKECIKCYCCHEMCSEHAIVLERSIVGKVVVKLVQR